MPAANLTKELGKDFLAPLQRHPIQHLFNEWVKDFEEESE